MFAWLRVLRSCSQTKHVFTRGFDSLAQEKTIDFGAHLCVISLGSNVSSNNLKPKDILTKAINLLADESIKIITLSEYYSTPAFPANSGPNFVNAVLTAQTNLQANETLEALHRIEQELGRTRTKRWEARVIDLDLIDFDRRVTPDLKGFNEWFELPLEKQTKLAPKELILPHPRMSDRSFVLIPMRDVAPDYVHPVLDQSIDQMIEKLSPEDIATITKIEA